MKKFGSLLVALAIMNLTAGGNLRAFADDSAAPEPKPDGPKVKPMFEDGKFKCSDGYDPDTDASLHPAGQDYRARQVINAQVQAAHEKTIVDQPAKTHDADSPGTAQGHSKTDAMKDSDGKGADAKKEAEKKAGEKDAKSADKEGQESKDDKESKEAKNKDAPKLNDKEASNPLNQALFAIQSKKYQASIDLLKSVIVKDAKNAQAHYLMAVSYVGLRNYPQAKEQYNTVLKLASANPKLSQLAEQGLKRISGSP